ncbi:hypothetical protein G9A89_012368 [Geosiphon pyriformis]|nr:hypothetical protein G9A89_012368 [Geosiphon pyriformis]
MVTENKSLAVIFSFKLEETINPPLFSRATLEEKPITVMYTDVKVDSHSIKLILDSGSAGSIITRQLMDQLGHQVNCAASIRIITADGATKTPIREINNFPIEVNSIIVPIKVLIMEATQYQALIGNNWLSSLARMANTHEYQPCVATSSPSPSYQVLWTNVDHNELLPIFVWDNNDNEKKKQRKKSTWEATIDTWTDNNQSEMPPILDWKEKNKEKGKGREKNIPKKTITAEEITKETVFNGSLGRNDMATQKDKASGTTNHNNISGRKRMYNTLCQYTILISDWVSCAIFHLDSYLHDEDEIWQMVNTKVKGALSSEILEIKNNPLKPTDIVLVLNLDTFIDLENSPEEFHEHY